VCFHDLWVLTTLSTGPIYFWNTCSYNVPRIGAITLTSSPNLTKPRLRAISAETGILPGLDGFQESTSSLSYSCHSQQWGLVWSCGMKLVGVEVCKLACFFVNIFCICVRFEEWQREGKKIDMLDDTGAYNMFKYDMIWYDTIWHIISSYYLMWYDMLYYDHIFMHNQKDKHAMWTWRNCPGVHLHLLRLSHCWRIYWPFLLVRDSSHWASDAPTNNVLICITPITFWWLWSWYESKMT